MPTVDVHLPTSAPTKPSDLFGFEVKRVKADGGGERDQANGFPFPEAVFVPFNGAEEYATEAAKMVAKGWRVTGVLVGQSDDIALLQGHNYGSRTFDWSGCPNGIGVRCIPSAEYRKANSRRLAEREEQEAKAKSNIVFARRFNVMAAEVIAAVSNDFPLLSGEKVQGLVAEVYGA